MLQITVEFAFGKWAAFKCGPSGPEELCSEWGTLEEANRQAEAVRALEAAKEAKEAKEARNNEGAK